MSKQSSSPSESKKLRQVYFNINDPYEKILYDFVCQYCPEDNSGNFSNWMKHVIAMYRFMVTGKMPGGEVTLPFFTSSPAFPPYPSALPPQQYVMPVATNNLQQEEMRNKEEEEKKRQRAKSQSAQQWLTRGKK